jgi:Domain of unknown function (DUF6916)
MSTSRRFFLKSGTLAALVAGFGLENVRFVYGQGTTDFPIPLEAQQEPTYMFNQGTFEPYVNSIFQAPDAQGRLINLTLQSVTPYRPKPRTKLTLTAARKTDSFSLMFRADRNLPPFTSIHRVRHAALGQFDLFLTPRTGIDGTKYYEGVFNHK